jgi:predicted O-methyltransferase YrrM
MNELMTYTRIQEYLTSLVPPRPGELKAMEDYAHQTDFPIIGPAAGYACYQIARMIGAQRVFELGSGYGYSTAWFARAVVENGGGEVHHTVWDETLSKKAATHLSRMGFEDVVKYHVAEAVETLRQIPGPFDLIFNDIDKEEYPASLTLVKEKLHSGGVLIIDNLLWHGRIFDDNDTSASTTAIRNFTQLITSDPDWVVTLLPIRDGLVVAYKQ